MANERRKRVANPSSTASARVQQDDEFIRNRAYEIFEERGRQAGRDWDDWLQAERELRPNREDE